MIYAIAAYTITLAVLALYGVLLQHRVRVYSSDRQALPNAGSATPSSRFNLGAALLSPVWMWAHGLRLPGVILLGFWLAVVPLYERELWIPLLFVGMVPLAAGAALGFVGNRVATAHRGPEGPAAFSASQLPWALAGVALYTVVLPWLWYARYAAA